MQPLRTTYLAVGIQLVTVRYQWFSVPSKFDPTLEHMDTSTYGVYHMVVQSQLYNIPNARLIFVNEQAFKIPESRFFRIIVGWDWL